MFERNSAAHIYPREPEVARLNAGFHLPAVSSLGYDNDTAVWAKQLEIKVAAANLGQAEYYLDRLKARVDYLEARAETEDGISRRELEELAWARSALPANAATLKALSDELEQGRQELETLLVQNRLALTGTVSIGDTHAEAR